MKEPRLVQDYLGDILEGMNKAEEFVGNLDLREFRKAGRHAGEGASGRGMKGADLSEHRRDTEAHRQEWRVREE